MFIMAKGGSAVAAVASKAALSASARPAAASPSSSKSSVKSASATAVRAASSPSPSPSPSAPPPAASAAPLSSRLASLLIRGPEPSPPSSRDPDLADLASSLPPGFPPPSRAVLAVSGCASRSASALATTPGSSSVLREAVIPYGRASLASFVSSHPRPPPEFMEGLSLTNGNGNGFAFASSAAALALSNAALHRSMELCSTLGEMGRCAGAGCAGALVSSDPSVGGRVHVAVCGADGGAIVADARLSAGGGGDRGGGGKDGEGEGAGGRRRRRSRVEEDEVSSSLLLLSMIRRAAGPSPRVDRAARSVADGMLDRDGDELAERALGPMDAAGGSAGEDTPSPVRSAAARVVSGVSSASLLIPTESSPGRGGRFGPTELVHAVLPPDPLIFPGSFNPPHVGHVALANAAVRAMGRKREEEWEEAEREGGFGLDRDGVSGGLSGGSSGPAAAGPDGVDDGTARPPSALDSIWSAVEYHANKSPPSVAFEMSLTNPDKPPMDVEEAARRVGLFGSCLETNSTEEEGTMDMPRDWGVLLTSAPLFVDKVRVLGGCIAPSRATYEDRTRDPRSTPRGRRRMTFIIGTDTMVRIIDPKYYGDGRDGMMEAVRDMGSRGVHFVVGGRLDQGGGDGAGTRFVTGEEELTSLPDDVRDMFTIIKEEDFRLDLSSTELRKRASGSAMSS